MKDLFKDPELRHLVAIFTISIVGFIALLAVIVSLIVEVLQ